MVLIIIYDSERVCPCVYEMFYLRLYLLFDKIYTNEIDWGRKMEVKILRYFLTIAREENISRASEVLHITQPALSRHMAQLEQEIGTQLFVRGRHLSLTETGILLRRRAEEVIDLMDKMERELNEKTEVAGVISIGSGALKSSRLLTDTMLKFHEHYPKVQYEFYSNNSEHIRERLDRGLLDFGLLLEPIDMERYDYIRIHEKERWGLFMRDSNPLAKKEKMTKDDLKGVPLVTPHRLSMQKEIARWLDHDFSSLYTLATCNVITNGTLLVDNGHVCFLTIEGSIDLMEGRGFVFRPLEPELFMTSVLAWKKYQPLPSASRAFLEFFKKYNKMT